MKALCLFRSLYRKLNKVWAHYLFSCCSLIKLFKHCSPARNIVVVAHQIKRVATVLDLECERFLDLLKIFTEMAT